MDFMQRPKLNIPPEDLPALREQLARRGPPMTVAELRAAGYHAAAWAKEQRLLGLIPAP